MANTFQLAIFSLAIVLCILATVRPFGFTSAGQIMTSSFRRWIVSGMLCASAAAVAIDGIAAEPSAPKSEATANVSGREIFLREWLPNDPRSHGGDGLGPVFNDTSCVSCHNQGGIGGGGAEAKNVVVITAVRTNFNRVPTAVQGQTIRPAPQTAVPQIVPDEQERKMLLKELKSLHPGLVTARSVVLHKSGTDPKYAAWRDKALGLDSSGLMNRFIAPIPQATVAAPPESAGGGFFTELAAQAQQSAIMELQPPMDMQLEKGRSLFSRIAIVIPVQELVQGGGGRGKERSLAAIPEGAGRRAAAAGTRAAADRVRVQEPAQDRRRDPVAHFFKAPSG